MGMNMIRALRIPTKPTKRHKELSEFDNISTSCQIKSRQFDTIPTIETVLCWLKMLKYA